MNVNDNYGTARLVANVANARFDLIALYDVDSGFSEKTRSQKISVARDVIEESYNFVFNYWDDYVPLDFLNVIVNMLIKDGLRISEFLVLPKQTTKDKE